MQVHNEIGFGYQESIYHNAMIVILENEGYKFETKKLINIFFQNKLLSSFCLDLLIENKIVVELKVVMGEMFKIFKT